jgi:hypothetical protein
VDPLSTSRSLQVFKTCGLSLNRQNNDFSDNPVGLINGLLCLTAVTELDLQDCQQSSGQAFSQIKPVSTEIGRGFKHLGW